MNSIGIIIYYNPDYFPPTINAINLLENEYKIIIFSRNIGDHLEFFTDNVRYYRFGKNISVKKSEKKFPLSKLTEYILFTFKTIYYSWKHKCKIIIVYDSYSLTTSLFLKIFRPNVKIFYHAHEIIEPKKDKWLNLRFWVNKITLKFAKKCKWVSQPDIKRAEFFSKIAGIKDVKVVRNFALSNLI